MLKDSHMTGAAAAMTDKWDIVLYLQAGAQVRYQSQSLSEIFGIISNWNAHRSNSPIASFRARRVKEEN